MNLRSVVRPVGADASPDQYVMPVVIYPLTVVGDGEEAELPAATVRTGQITITTAGTAVQGTATAAAARVAVKAHPDNADTVWWGNDGAGDVTSSNGFPLNPGEGIVLPGNLDQYWFDADSNGDKVCWGIVE